MLVHIILGIFRAKMIERYWKIFFTRVTTIVPGIIRAFSGPRGRAYDFWAENNKNMIEFGDRLFTQLLSNLVSGRRRALRDFPAEKWLTV